MFGHQKKQENQSPIDYRKQEKHNKHMEQLGQLGAVAAGSYEMHEKHKAKKDPEHAHTHRIKEEVAATVAVGSAGFALHEHHKKKCQSILFFVLSTKQDGRYLERSSWSSANSTIQENSSSIVQVIDSKSPTPEEPKGNETALSTKELESNDTKASVKNEPENSDNLEELLKKAATKDKNVIITSVNEAWAAPNSLLDLFLESFRSGESIDNFLDNLIIITLDPKAYERCSSLHSFCYMLKGANFAGEKVYMTSDYFDLVWTKVKMQQRILELGYNFLFTDVDIMWFRNPFERFAPDADMSTSCDFFFGDENSPWNFPNTGFLYVKSRPKNIELFKYWHESRDKFPPNHEQWVFNQIKFDVVHRMRLKIQFLSTTYNMGFCNSTNDFDKLYTMHANCCVGVGAKLHDLRSLLNDWNRYKALTEEERKKGPVSWKVPGICMH